MQHRAKIFYLKRRNGNFRDQISKLNIFYSKKRLSPDLQICNESHICLKNDWKCEIINWCFEGKNVELKVQRKRWAGIIWAATGPRKCVRPLGRTFSCVTALQFELRSAAVHLVRLCSGAPLSPLLLSSSSSSSPSSSSLPQLFGADISFIFAFWT